MDQVLDQNRSLATLKPAKDERPLRRSKTQESVSRRWAVKQTALLLFQLLGGEGNKSETKLKSWFNPVDELGDAANAILFRGLQGSSRFGSGALFVQSLNLAHVSTKESLKTLSKPPPSLLAVAAASPNVQVVIRRFNRQTAWLSLGVLGPMIIATLLLLAVGNQPRPGADWAAPGQTPTTFVPKSVPVAQPASSVDHEAPKSSANQDPPPGMETAPSPQLRVATSAPEIEEPDLDVGARLSPTAPEQNSPQAMRPKVHVMRFKTAHRPKTIDVKARLIELWHQSLAHRPGPQTQFSNQRQRSKELTQTPR